jgi:diaminopimelate decarboxylase/aspartate kinase
MKFGGTSVSSAERWRTIAAVCRQRLDEGRRPLVVCSAFSGVSDLLDRLLVEAVRGDHRRVLEDIERRHLDIGRDLGVDASSLVGSHLEELSRLALGASLVHEATPRLKARVMAAGELMSTRLGAAHLEKQGLETAWLDAREMLRAEAKQGVPEQRRYLSATCAFEPDAGLQAELEAIGSDVILTQGFIAADRAGETVLLGRGGSDTSAAYFAARIEAELLEIWTDVPGMFTANPHEIPSARLLRQLDYLEAQELATMGARVLHPRCIEPVRRYGIPLHIRCTQAPHLDGTVIADAGPDFGAQVKAISAKTGVTLISMDTLGMWQEVGFLADLFSIFKRHNMSIDLVATSETNVTVSLDASAGTMEPARVEALLADLNRFCSAGQIAPCAVVSLVGRHIRSILDEIGPAFEVFHEQRIYQVSQAASDLNFSFVVDEDQAWRLVGRLNAQLFEKREPDRLFGPTWQEMLSAPGERAPAVPWWQRRREELLELAREHDSAYVYDEDTLRRHVADVQQIAAVDRVFYAVKANANRDVLRLVHDAGLGFECVSPGEIDRVRGLFPRLDHRRLLFTPNFAPREDYVRGFEAGAFVTLDNLYPLEAWPDVFEGHELLARIDPGQGHGHHRYVHTAGAQSKFGVAPDEIPRLVERASEVGATIIGLHAHVGSGIDVADSWSQTALFLAALAGHFPGLRYIDVGGGLGVGERQGTSSLDLSEVAARLAEVKAAHPQFELWLEPGRYLVARAGVLLSRVTQVKRKGSACYVGVGTGMNSLLRPALYGAYHQIVNLSKLDRPLAVTADVVGPICETGDVLGYGRRLPETDEGDVLLIATAGAYGRVMSSSYNLREPAPEVFLKSAANQTS